MNPITLGLTAVGLGLQLFGGSQQSQIAHQQAQVSMGIASDEQAINAQRQQQMQLEARRQQMENFRNAQRLRAQGTAAAVNQGAQFGSGLQGSLAENTSEALFNAQGINQSLQIGNNIFGITNDIDAKKIQLAQLGGSASTAQGYSNLGAGIVKSAPIAGAFGKDATTNLNWLSGGPTGFLNG